jgi:hypothetical protein
MPTVFRRVHEQNIDTKVCNTTTSTLLVPENLFLHLQRILPVSTSPSQKNSINFRMGLKFLLNKYRGFLAIGNLPFSSKPKLTFQNDGLNLIPAKFRPDNADWFELGILAYGLGVSRCWLFSYLVELELSGVGEFMALKPVRDVVATPSISRPRLIQQISGKRHFIRRILHFRI